MLWTEVSDHFSDEGYFFFHADHNSTQNNVPSRSYVCLFRWINNGTFITNHVNGFQSLNRTTVIFRDPKNEYLESIRLIQ
jgi:hypothetical protein